MKISQDNIVFDGDSITEGVPGPSGYGRPTFTVRLLSSPVNSFNAALGGDTVCGRLAKFDENVASNFNPNARNNILSFLIGTNDLLRDDRPANVVSENIDLYCMKAKTLGFKIALGTVLPFGNHAYLRPTAEHYSQLNSLNDNIRQSVGKISDIIIDYAAHPLMGQTASVTNEKLYVDGVHPTALGYFYMAEQEAAALKHLLTSAS